MFMSVYKSRMCAILTFPLHNEGQTKQWRAVAAVIVFKSIFSTQNWVKLNAPELLTSNT